MNRWIVGASRVSTFVGRCPRQWWLTRFSTQAHYENHSASSYESAYFYSPGEYTERLCQLVRNGLGWKKTTNRRLLDLGGGTGNFTKLILQASPGVDALVVDPFLEGKQDKHDRQIEFVKGSAEAFKDEPDLWWRDSFDQVLMKEVVHHLKPKDRVDIFRGILMDANRLDSGDPSILILTRPLDSGYPLWPEAKEVRAKHQPSVEEITTDLEKAGFPNVSYTMETCPCTIEFDEWLNMVERRCWSVFSYFSDEELEDGCEQLIEQEKERIDEDGNIHFEDRIAFISASK